MLNVCCNLRSVLNVVCLGHLMLLNKLLSGIFVRIGQTNENLSLRHFLWNKRARILWNFTFTVSNAFKYITQYNTLAHFNVTPLSGAIFFSRLVENKHRRCARRSRSEMIFAVKVSVLIL